MSRVMLLIFVNLIITLRFTCPGKYLEESKIWEIIAYGHQLNLMTDGIM